MNTKIKKMLTEEEIKKIKDGVVIITVDDAIKIMTTGKIKVIKPALLNNGYMVGYSIEKLRSSLHIHHISVSNSKGKTDPADAEYIARDILGKEYQSMGPMNLKNVFHFTKIISGGD